MSTRQSCDVGISEYLGSHDGFSGIIKMRFQDFIVNEIDKDGNVIHLTNMNLPNDDEEDTPESKAGGLSDADKNSLAEFVKSPDTDHVLLTSGNGKEERTKTHQAIRFLYPELESQTVDSENGTKLIKVTRVKKGMRSRENRTRRPRNKLCKFVLHKQNIGTMEAVNFIAKKLHVHKANGFQYAGTKDKRGVTTQLITAPVAAERLLGLNKLTCNVKVGNFSYCTKPLQLGALGGNRFSIIIRNVKGDSDSSFQAFAKNGFINYFGLQRFGTTSIPTHSIGIAILKSDWQKVVDLILTPRDADSNPSLNEALKKFNETADPEKALEYLRYKSSIEGILLQALKRFGKSQLLQAITVLPRNTRKMYVHAYQSYVWNKVASKRIKELGDSPCAGDLVYTSTFNERLADSEDKLEEPPVKKQRSEDNFNEISEDSVTAISNDNLNQFTIGDIVLPLPGHNIVYPENVCKLWYDEIMKEDELDIDRHTIHKVKDYSLPGDYRHLVTIPSNAEFDLVKYDDFSLPLLQTDADVLKQADAPANVADGKYIAARVKFDLPPSSYATIALRELMKSDISLPAQKKLNEEHGSFSTREENKETNDGEKTEM